MLVCGLFMAGAGAAAGYLAFGGGSSSDIPSFFYRLRFFHSGQEEAPSSRLQASSSSVSWRNWSSSLLKRAQEEDRLIFLYLSSSWDASSRKMEEETFSDPAVAQWIEKNVLPVSADTDERPDLARIYFTAWPTAAFLLPTGEVLSSASYSRPDSFLAWGERVLKSFKQSKEELEKAREKRKARLEKARALLEAPLPGGSAREDALPDGLLYARRIFEKIASEYDPRNSGFGKKNKFILSSHNEFLMDYWKASKDSRALKMLEKTLKAQKALEDPVSGGFYRYSTTPDWKSPRKEKLLSVQSDVILDYSRAYEPTQNPLYLETVRRTAGYLKAFLSSPEGGYYLGQSAWGSLDKSLYASYNARAIRASLAASRLLKDEELKAFALKSLGRFLKESVDLRGGVFHGMGKKIPYGLAEDQIELSRACLAAYGETKDGKYLSEARRLLRFIEENLLHPEGFAAYGGLWSEELGEGPEPLADLESSIRLAGLYLEFGDREKARKLMSWLSMRTSLLGPSLEAPMARLSIRN